MSLIERVTKAPREVKGAFIFVLIAGLLMLAGSYRSYLALQELLGMAATLPVPEQTEITSNDSRFSIDRATVAYQFKTNLEAWEVIQFYDEFFQKGGWQFLSRPTAYDENPHYLSYCKNNVSATLNYSDKEYGLLFTKTIILGCS